MTWLLDLDGVVWLAEDPIPGSGEAIAALRQRHGRRVVFLTNNSSARVGEYLAKLERCGVPTTPEDLITSAQAAATLVAPGETALVCAGPGVEEALQARGVRTIRTGRADAVVVGWHRDFDFARLTAAFDAVHAGARLIGTNDDATYPTPSGPLPGGGSILAAVAYATGATPASVVVVVASSSPAVVVVGAVVDVVELVVVDDEVVVEDVVVVVPSVAAPGPTM